MAVADFKSLSLAFLREIESVLTWTSVGQYQKTCLQEPCSHTMGLRKLRR